MANNPVIWFEIYVQDMARAKAFYEAVFQFTFEPLPNPNTEMWRFPSAMGEPGASGSLVKMEGAPSAGTGTLVYFSCDNCAVEAGRAAAHGGRIHRDKTSIGEYGFIVLVKDTEGNMIGLHSMK